MQLNRVTQAYLSVLSIFVLALIGAGTYVWQSGNAPVSTADQVITSAEPVLSLVPVSNQLNVGDQTTVALNGSFIDEAVTGAQLLISYPPDMIDVVSQDDTNGVLEKSTNVSVDPLTGTVSLTYAPLTGYIGTGTITTLTIKAKKSGVATLTTDIESQLDPILPTRLTTVNSLSVIPQIINTTLTIN